MTTSCVAECCRKACCYAGGHLPVTLDEVQREPDLLNAVKLAIDRERRPGQFLIPGSANLLLMGKVSESLTGRASYLTLWPMTRREQRGLGVCGIWEDLVKAPGADWRELLLSQSVEPEHWRALDQRGGFPTPAADCFSAHSRGPRFHLCLSRVTCQSSLFSSSHRKGINCGYINMSEGCKILFERPLSEWLIRGGRKFGRGSTVEHGKEWHRRQ